LRKPHRVGGNRCDPQESKMKVQALFAAAALTIAALPVQAADLYNRGRPAPVYTVNQPMSAYSWIGPYVGVNLGGQWGKITNAPGIEPAGLNGGVQAGYSWQFGQWVVGGETDLQLSGADDTFAPWKFSNPWYGTVRGRVGLAMDNILFYGTGGLAYGRTRAETFFASESHTSAGWTVGAGVEMGFNRNWSAKAEYLYIDLNNTAFGLTGLTHGSEFNVLRLGVNYRF
jgi:outer membrane immunogenic protein